MDSELSLAYMSAKGVLKPRGNFLRAIKCILLSYLIDSDFRRLLFYE